MSRNGSWVLTAAIFVILSGVSISLAGVEYIVTDLGTPGEVRSYAYSLNNVGQVLGLVWPDNPYESRNLLWDPVCGKIDLTSMDLGTNQVCSLNDQGVLVYAQAVEGIGLQARTLDLGSTPQAIGWFGPRDINGLGEVAGEVGGRGVVWDQAQGVRELPLLAGGTYMGIGAMNARGQVVGGGNTGIPSTGQPDQHSIPTPWVQSHVYIWDPVEGIRDLGTLGGDFAWARGCNDLGQIVGLSYTSGDAEYRAFLWDETGGMRDLETLPGHEDSEAVAINNAGQVIGMSGVFLGEQAGFIYDPANGMRPILDLVPGGLGWSRFEPMDLNDAGQIIGQAVTITWEYDNSGFYREVEHERAFLLTPVPEPPMPGLFFAAIATVLVRRRNRNT